LSELGLLEQIGNIPPAEAEARYYARSNEHAMTGDSNQNASGKPGAAQYPGETPD
jgi:hypothetical protein